MALTGADVDILFNRAAATAAIRNVLDEEIWGKLGYLIVGSSFGAATGMALGILAEYTFFTVTLGPWFLAPAAFCFVAGAISGQKRYNEIQRRRTAEKIVSLPGGNRVLLMNEADAVTWMNEHAAEILALLQAAKEEA